MSFLPWPLDGAQQFFEGLWNFASAAANMAFEWVSNSIVSRIKWMWDRISDLVCWIQGGVYDFGRWLLSQIDGVVRAIINSVVDAFKGIIDVVSSIVQSIINTIVDKVNWVVDQVRNVGGWIVQQITNVVSNITNVVQSAIAGVGNFINNLINAAVSGLSALINSVLSTLSDVGNTILAAVGNAAGQVVSTILNAIEGAKAFMETVLHGALSGVAGALGEGLKALINWLIGSIAALAKTLIGSVIAVATTIKNILLPPITTLVNQAVEFLRPHSPPEEIKEPIEEFSKEILKTVEELSKVEKHSVPSYEALAVAAGAVIARFFTLKVALQSMAMAADAAHPTKELGFQKMAAGVIAALDMPSVIGPILRAPIEKGVLKFWEYQMNARYTPEIPGTQDLITFVVREVIPPEMFYEQMKYKGFSEDWSRAYWEAHWRLPSPEMIYDVFHRTRGGKNVVAKLSEGEVRKYIIWHDYKPEPRPGIGVSDVDIALETTYELIGRIDIRRAWEFGHITDEELENHYRALGYSDADAKLMAEIHKSIAMNEEIMGVVRALINAYKSGWLSDDELKKRFKELGLPEKRMEYYIMRAKVEIDAEEKEEYLRAYREAFRKGKINKSEFEALLVKLGLQAWRLNAILRFEEARQKIEEKAAAS